MTGGEPCSVVTVLDDGTPVVRLGDAERALRIHGVEVPQPPPPLYIDILTRRLGRAGTQLRCEEPPGPAPGRPPDDQPGHMKFYYLAWRDKSGDVWEDLALTLLREGVVRVAEGPFPERDEYLSAEDRARHDRLGVWGDHVAGGD